MDKAPVYLMCPDTSPLPPSNTILLNWLFFVSAPCKAIVPHERLFCFLKKIGFFLVPNAINLFLKIILAPLLISKIVPGFISTESLYI